MPRRDTNFRYSFAVLPADKRAAIVAVWDFFRAVDDAVDEIEKSTPGVMTSSHAVHSGSGLPGDQRHAAAAEAIASWRREVAACYGEGHPRTPQGRALVPHIAKFRLPRQGFADVVEGVAMDVSDRRWATFDELYEYCLRVASAVGLVCIEIFGYTNPGCRRYAIDLGIALQLTNILRDLGKDHRAGRLYVPQADLERFGVTEDDLRAGAVAEPVRRLLEFQAKRAHDYFDKAAGELPPEDAASLLAARIMGAIYQALLRRIERSGFAVFGETLRLPRWRKALIALSIWARG